MIPIPFNPDTSILAFRCKVEHKRSTTLYLVLDTGATNTIISKEAAENIGYELDKVTEQTTFSDASCSHIVPRVILKSISLSGARLENIAALCYTIPEEHGIDGVIGLNFLRHFNISLNFEQGLLTLERIKAR